MEKFSSLLKTLPPVELCCIYGSTLHPNNYDKTSMIDYILGVKDPLQWHAENLKMNKNHYASWMVRLGGERLITGIADNIGVGVHFNPFVSHNGQVFKYGVARMRDLVLDIEVWDSFYLSGRLQKPVNIIVDNMDVAKLNHINLKTAISAALLLLPSTFSEEELYAKICSLSYMGDLRMLFAEDKNKVKKIVQGQFELFKKMYRPHLEEFASQNLCRLSYSAGEKMNITQDHGLSTTSSLVSSLPPAFIRQIGVELREEKLAHVSDEGGIRKRVVINSREGAAERLQKILSRKVMVSSARQAVAGFLTVGIVHGLTYLGNKMRKAWRS